MTTPAVVYYTDSTPPVAYTGTYEVGIAGATTAATPYIKYALYKDDTTWNAWSEWAVLNALEFDRTTKYSSIALQIIGYWPTMAEGENSFMCIEDMTSSSKGAVCMEARITGTTYATATYRIPTANTKTKITDFADVAAAKLATKDFVFTAYSTTAAPPVAVPVVTADTVAKTGDFKSFEVMNCTLNSISMDCRQWVPGSTGEADGGYKMYAHGTSVKFYWFDGRDISGVAGAVATSKFKSATVTMKYDAAQQQLAIGATALLLALFS
jgi:hypothetical protein